MNCDNASLLLYAVTDRSWLHGQTLYAQAEQALQGGATFLQLREKELDEAHFKEEAVALKALCRQYGVPFVLDDNVALAIETNADGVHVGQSDMAAGKVRELIGPDKILGVSAQTVEDALLAEREGADYLGVGAVFPTGTKTDANAVSYDTLREICAAVSIPVIAIGGITKDNVARLSGSGIVGVAGIRPVGCAIMLQDGHVKVGKVSRIPRHHLAASCEHARVTAQLRQAQTRLQVGHVALPAREGHVVFPGTGLGLGERVFGLAVQRHEHEAVI